MLSDVRRISFRRAALGTSIERLLACCGLAQCACTLRPREPLFTPGVSAWAVLGGRCHDTVYSTTCGRIKKNAHPGASLLASLLPSLLILEEKEGEKQGWGAFPSTFFLFDHMWSNKRCHDTCPQHAPVPLRAGVNRVDRGSDRPRLAFRPGTSARGGPGEFAERCSAHTFFRR